MYKRKDRETLPLFKDLMPFGGFVDTQNRWFIYESLIPWNELEEEYSKVFSHMGRPARDGRLIIGAYCIKLMMGLSNEEVEAIIRENPYMQYFCGFEEFQTQKLFDPQLLSQLNVRFGAYRFDEFDFKIRQILNNNKMLHPQYSQKSLIKSGYRWFRMRMAQKFVKGKK